MIRQPGLRTATLVLCTLVIGGCSEEQPTQPWPMAPAERDQDPTVFTNGSVMADPVATPMGAQRSPATTGMTSGMTSGMASGGGLAGGFPGTGDGDTAGVMGGPQTPTATPDAVATDIGTMADASPADARRRPP